MRRLWLPLAALLMLAGCASGAIGSRCAAGPNDPNACVEGAVCAPAPSSSTGHPSAGNVDGAYCRQLCDEPSECTEPGFECRVVAGSMFRACQPIVRATTGDAGP